MTLADVSREPLDAQAEEISTFFQLAAEREAERESETRARNGKEEEETQTMSVEKIIVLSELLEAEMNETCKGMRWLAVPMTKSEYLLNGTEKTGREFHCSFCGVWYSGLWWRSSSRFGFEYLGEHVYLCKVYAGQRHVAEIFPEDMFFPVCSEVCGEALDRTLCAYEKERREEWKAINQARQILKEARAFLKRRDLQDPLNLPKKESEPELISQTS